MTSDFGVTAGHVEYSNRRFDFDTRHMVMIEVYRHTEALEQFDYELPVYDRNEPYRARLYLSEDEFKTVRRMELNGILRTPVSYTHLDVYKRQRSPSLPRRPR